MARLACLWSTRKSITLAKARPACSTACMRAACERNVPSAPLQVNLDATTLCALVSSLSNDDASKQWYADWAHGNAHWQQCLEQVQTLSSVSTPSLFTDEHALANNSLADVAYPDAALFGGPCLL